MATLESMTVRLGIDTDALRDGADRAKDKLAGIGKAVMGLGAGVPVAAAVAAGVGGMAAAFASAGVAAKAFQLAAGPQLAAVTEAADAATKAEEAHDVATRKTAAAQKLAAKGGEEYEAALREAEAATKAAKDADDAYAQQMADMPKSTRAMAKELAGLKDDHEEWSNSLADTTMPIFTKGLQVARRLLPMLTPFVKAAAGAFGEFVDEIDRGTRGKGLESFAQSMAKIAGQNLKSLLTGMKNIAVGIGGIIRAFLPFSSTMSGGFEESTAAFAQWGQSLHNSQGFAEFVTLARQGAQTLGTLATTALKLITALAPLIGITATIALSLANLINSLPPPVVQALAYAILAAVVALKAFRAASAAVDAATALMNSTLALTVRRWAATAAASIKSGARMAASAVANAARTAGAWAAAAARATATWLATMIRVAAVTAARFAMMAGRAIAWAAVMAAQWLVAFWPVALVIAAVAGLVALVIIYWDEITAATQAAWDWVVAKLVSAKDGMLAAVRWLGRIPGWVRSWFTQAKDWAIQRAVALVDWLKGYPGRIAGALSGLLGALRQRTVTAFQSMKDAAIQRAVAVVDWLKGYPSRLVHAIGNLSGLLWNHGRDLVLGLWEGIKAMGSWLRDTLIGWAKNIIPGPIADALGISSPSKLMADQIGRWVPPGIVEGAEDAAPAMNRDLARLVEVPGLDTVNRHQTRAAAGAGAGGAPNRLVIELRGGSRAFREFFQETVRLTAGGDVIKFAEG
ncbi:hypothetical protein AB0L04_22410 [Streptomyces glaucescens]|uniref:hypothetical protein n=1 Tax=Streptomyces glaucescens TaxID=1907 RepID=UPI00344E47EF